MVPTPLLEVKNVTKKFPGVVANYQVNLAVFPGEIVGLVGENGAGKTTLMRIIFGLERPDEGEIFWEGKKVRINSPRDAMSLGIGMVHQHFQLFPSLSVLENVVLGNEPVRGIVLDRNKAYKKVTGLAERFGFDLDLRVPVRSLSVGQQQKVELLKALYRNLKLLILDEPTAVLTPQEIESFLMLLKQLAIGGIAIILISHKLKEVLGTTTKIVVMRKGRVVASVKPGEVTEEELAKLMIGGETGYRTLAHIKDVKTGKPMLTVENLVVLGDHGRPAVNRVSFEVSKGEIVGLAGVEGNGQQELIEALVGVRRVRGGKVVLDGREITNAPASLRRQLGLAVIPGDRIREGAIPLATVAENLIPVKYRSRAFCIGGVLKGRVIRKFVKQAIEAYHIIAESDTKARNLSGGNLQRLVIARELSTSPKVLIAVHPTRGLDVRSTAEVHQHLLDLRNNGLAVLLVSTDLDELLDLSDRILVIFRGRIVGEVSPRVTTPQELGLLMLGGDIQSAETSR